MMSSKIAIGTLTGALLAVSLTACNSLPFMESKKIDYKSAGKLPPLEIPPDLTAPTTDERYAVPDINPKGTATYSVYDKERAGRPQAGASDLLPAQEKARVERAGSQRWLVVNASPEQVWPMVKEFWQELGFNFFAFHEREGVASR